MVNTSDKNNINFTKNVAKILGNTLYQEVSELCNIRCLNNRMVGINNELITTPPKELKFFHPAICIDDDNDTQCNKCYVKNIMLGREIVITACVLDYYINQSNDSMQFLVESETKQNYFFSGPKEILISCGAFQGISIMGNQSLLKSTNFSVNITLNVDPNVGWKQISVTLIVELPLCHLGLWQYSKSQSCECYNDNDIVFCFGSNSTIKRGY